MNAIKNNIELLLNKDEILKIMYVDVSKKSKDSDEYLFKGIFGILKSPNNIKSKTANSNFNPEKLIIYRNLKFCSHISDACINAIERYSRI